MAEDIGSADVDPSAFMGQKAEMMKEEIVNSMVGGSIGWEGFFDKSSISRSVIFVAVIMGGIDQKAGFNPGLTVLLVVVGAVLIFCVGNYMLYFYAQKNLPPRKKKAVSKKKQKRERLKAGMAPAGD